MARRSGSVSAVRKSTTRRIMVVLAASWARRSPTTMSGTRTFERMMSKIVWLGRPRMMIFAIGRRNPSSNSSRESAESRPPPTSGECAMFAAYPTMRLRWKIGLTKTMSLSWEVPIHGSLVMRLSPGASVRGGNARRK